MCDPVAHFQNRVKEVHQRLTSDFCQGAWFSLATVMVLPCKELEEVGVRVVVTRRK